MVYELILAVSICKLTADGINNCYSISQTKQEPTYTTLEDCEAAAAAFFKVENGTTTIGHCQKAKE